MLCTVFIVLCCFFFFFKQKTAYEMRISDWSSDVCSSDLSIPSATLWKEKPTAHRHSRRSAGLLPAQKQRHRASNVRPRQRREISPATAGDRKSAAQVSSVVERADLGGRGIIKNNKPSTQDVIYNHKHTHRKQRTDK